MSKLTGASLRLSALIVAGLIAALALAVPAGEASTPLTVFGAASLTRVLPKIDPSARYSFAGSGTLETQIEQGAPADVFAAASDKQPAALYAAGLSYAPIEFATNVLVMIVPKDNPAHITSVNDITKPGVKIVVCNASQPCGDYASNAFANLGITAAADANIVSQETDVTQVVAEIAAGEGDVGFVYITDADAAKGKVKAIALPAAAKPNTQDVVTIIKSTTHLAAAKAFVAQLLSRTGQATLRAAGFGKG